MPKSDELTRPEPPEKRGSWLGIILALIFCSIVFVVLTFLTFGFFSYLLVVVGVIFGIVTFHYLTWGWWLGKVIRQASEKDDDA